MKLAALTAIFIMLNLLCGCPKRQWHYTPPQAPATAKDFDAHWDPAKLDPNGAAMNIDWSPQLQGRIPNPDVCNDGQPYSDACTQDHPFLDQPNGLHEAFCFLGKVFSGSPPQPFFGHSDWMAAQYTGAIGWFNFGDDWDYDLLVVPGGDNLPPAPGNAHGITTNNNFVGDDSSKPRYMEIEFDSDEADPVFTKGCWSNFNAAGHANDPDTLDRKFFHAGNNCTSEPSGTDLPLACGSVVGLFGLDCDHGCRSELHPVYGLAIQRTADPSDNEWSVMVRNWGTGGYCSQYNDELDETSISLILPVTSSQQPAGTIQDFVATSTDSKAKVSCPKIYFADGKTVLNVTLPRPKAQSLASFSLKLQWPAGAEPAACGQIKHSDVRKAVEGEARRAMPVRLPGGQEYKGRGEDYMADLMFVGEQAPTGTMELTSPQARSHDAQERESLRSVLARHNAALKARLDRMNANRREQVCDGPIQVIPTRAPQPKAHVTDLHDLKPDVVKTARDDAIRKYICSQYKGQPPVGTKEQFDAACQGAEYPPGRGK